MTQIAPISIPFASETARLSSWQWRYAVLSFNVPYTTQLILLDASEVELVVDGGRGSHYEEIHIGHLVLPTDDAILARLMDPDPATRQIHAMRVEPRGVAAPVLAGCRLAMALREPIIVSITDIIHRDGPTDAALGVILRYSDRWGGPSRRIGGSE